MATPLICVVCTEAVTETTEAWCSSCGSVYHLNQRSDLPGRDCGDVWINEEHLGLEFSCSTCLNPAPAGLEDVLDLEEAAALAGVDPSWLSLEAAAGRVPHRKTSGGVLLFGRGDILAIGR